jgi:BolA-like protein 3
MCGAMLCFQCRRIALAAIRRTPKPAPARQLIAPSSLNKTGLSPNGVLLTLGRPAKPLSFSYYSTASHAATSKAPMAAPSSPEKPDYLDNAESEIWDKLAAEFAPTELMVQDVSGGCGSMYGIEIASEKFRGANMLKQQRMVNAVLGDQMKSWHGVQLRTKVPS